MKNLIALIVFLVELAIIAQKGYCSETYSNLTFTVSMATYGLSKDGNAVYIATTAGNVQRHNYTKYLNTADFTYTTSHSEAIRTVAVSKGERYFATGG